MSVIKWLLRFVRSMLLPSADPAKAPVAAADALVADTVPIARVVPAVAAYERRIPATDFMLAARLHSVARLNTPEGRIPHAIRHRAPPANQRPATAGGKKIRDIKGPVVLSRIKRPTAEVIPFPVKPAERSQAERLAA